MALSGWLIDKSALVRLASSKDSAEWAERIERGMVGICTVTRLEVGHSARSVADRVGLFGSPPIASLMIEHFTPASEDRALEVQGLLADIGQHRAPSLADLLLAAVAEQRRLTVLHVDKDFDLIASVTGQPVETLRI